MEIHETGKLFMYSPQEASLEIPLQTTDTRGILEPKIIL